MTGRAVLYLLLFLLLAVEFPWEREAQPQPVTQSVEAR